MYLKIHCQVPAVKEEAEFALAHVANAVFVIVYSYFDLGMQGNICGLH